MEIGSAAIWYRPARRSVAPGHLASSSASAAVVSPEKIARLKPVTEPPRCARNHSSSPDLALEFGPDQRGADGQRRGRDLTHQLGAAIQIARIGLGILRVPLPSGSSPLNTQSVLMWISRIAARCASLGKLVREQRVEPDRRPRATGLRQLLHEADAVHDHIGPDAIQQIRDVVTPDVELMQLGR